jgi:hypothetical protein
VTGSTRVYRINPARLLVLPAVWLGFVSLLLGWFGRSAAPGDAAAGVGAAVILTLIFAPIFYLTVWRARLELDSAGISQFQFGYTIRSSWANLEHLSLQPGAEGLYLREPGTDSRLLRGSVKVVQGVSHVTGVGSVIGDAEALAQGRFIALMPFTSHLRDGPLRQDLERWAPQLFRVDANGHS